MVQCHIRIVTTAPRKSYSMKETPNITATLDASFQEDRPTLSDSSESVTSPNTC